MPDETNDRSRETIVAYLKAENDRLRAKVKSLQESAQMLAEALGEAEAKLQHIDGQGCTGQEHPS